MNKTKIDWCDYSWNPVTGCYHDCKYCYARKIANRFCRESDYMKCKANDPKSIHEIDEALFKDDYKGTILPYPYKFEPTFHKHRLNKPSRKTKGVNIFVCSMADLFGEWVPDEWIGEVFEACKKAPQHRYLFLTKNFIKASNFRYADNWWIGKTITNNDDARFSEGDPWNIDGINRANQFLSIEPIHGEISYLKYYLYSFKWIIVGAESGNRKDKVIPQKQWIMDIKNQCRSAGVPIFMKESLRELMGQDFIQEFPW